MSFPRYESYKDSGIEWLGEVPGHWELKKLKHNLRLLTEKTERRVNPVALENIESWSGRFIQTATTFEGEGVAFEPGDILFGKLRPYLAKAYLAECAGEAVGDFHVIRPIKDTNSRFSQYQILNREFIAIVDSSTFGAKMPRVSWDFLSNMVLTAPPFPEQQTIATFLDRETAKIDELIAEQQRLIELLKEKRQAVISHAVIKGLNPDAPMKDTGIEWLGEVPEHWEVKRMRFIADVQGGIAKGKNYSGNETIEVPYLRVANVQDGFLNLENVTTIEILASELDRYRLRVGDVLMNEGGDYDKLGRGHVWNGEIEPCIHQNHVFAVRPKAVGSKWLNEITGSDYAQFYFMTRSKQSTNLASISSTNIMELPVVLPLLLEQEQILALLVDQREKFDNLTAEANRAIELLKERRTALISAAVTGKIDVRGLVNAPHTEETRHVCHSSSH